MTNTTLDNPQVGDLVMDLNGDLGSISLVETDKFGTLYFVLWFNGTLKGYTTAHKLKEVEVMRINLQLNT